MFDGTMTLSGRLMTGISSSPSKRAPSTSQLSHPSSMPASASSRFLAFFVVAMPTSFRIVITSIIAQYRCSYTGEMRVRRENGLAVLILVLSKRFLLILQYICTLTVL